MVLERDPYRVLFSLPVLAGKKSDAENPLDILPPKAALSAALFVRASRLAKQRKFLIGGCKYVVKAVDRAVNYLNIFHFFLLVQRSAWTVSGFTAQLA